MFLEGCVAQNAILTLEPPVDDLRKTCGKRLLILIRSRDTCVRCATDSSMFEGIDGTSVVIL